MILLPLLLAAAGAGEAVDIPLDCDEPMTQQDMNHCARLDYADADAALNQQWRRTAEIMKLRDENFESTFDERPGYFQTLLDGQRAWLQYRERHCVSEGYLFRGGSMEPFMVSTCKTHLTKLRTAELRELVEFSE